MRRWIPENVKAAVVADYKAGMNVNVIMAKHGCSQRAIYDWVSNEPKHGYSKQRTKHISLDKDTAEVILKLIAYGIQYLNDKEAPIASVLEQKILDVADDLTIYNYRR